jgi:DNA helicase-2/ATP-dependent DNA helicase PcrA
VRQEDLPMLAMVCKALHGLKTRSMKHIVVDECQDFSPFQVELLKQANPAATFTLVGDLYQGVRADEGIRNWEEWTGPVFGNLAELKQLTVSYRNTVEIMRLAQSVAARYPIEGICGTRPVLRHGEEPRIVRTDGGKDRLDRIREQVRAWRAEGFYSIALIEKTADRAKALFRQLGAELDAHLLSESDAEYRGGVMILPASICKGMEFDCVGICDASAANFPEDEFLCRVLYVMMTRPLHRLCVWYEGEVSPMLAGERRR